MGVELTEELSPQPWMRQFCQLLSLVAGGIVPTTLLQRGCSDRPTWSRSGEIASRSPNEVLVPECLIPLFGSATGVPVEIQLAIEQGAVRLEEHGSIQYIKLCHDWREVIQLQAPVPVGSEGLFDILSLVMHAFPEPYADLVWEETQYQLWAVMESTCLSILSVMGEDDLREYLAAKPSDVRGPYLTRLLTFLSQILSVLSKNTPIWVCPLISIVLRLVEAEPSIPVGETESLRLLVNLNFLVHQARSRKEAPADFIQQLQNLDYRHDERSNAAVGIAISSLPPRIKFASLVDHSENFGSFWTPISDEKPSALEAIALAKLIGRTSTQAFSSLSYFGNLDIETRALIAFDLARDGNPEEARAILEKINPAIKDQYGANSPEYIISISELINCCNALSAEETGESHALAALSRLPHPFSSGILGLHYLILSYVDSLIGLARYTEAVTQLLDILHEPSISSEIATKAALRMLKCRRRQNREWCNDYTVKSLKVLVGNFLLISDALKAECVDEISCNMSLVDKKREFQVRVAYEVIVALQACMARWRGNDTLNSWHLEALARYSSAFARRISVMDIRSSRKPGIKQKQRSIPNSLGPTPTPISTLLDLFRTTSRTIQTLISWPLLEHGKTAWSITWSGIGLVNLTWVTRGWQELAVSLLLGNDSAFTPDATKMAVIDERGQIVLKASLQIQTEDEVAEACLQYLPSFPGRRASLAAPIQSGSRVLGHGKGQYRPKWQRSSNWECDKGSKLVWFKNPNQRDRVAERVSSDQSSVCASMGFRVLFMKLKVVLRHYKGF